MPKRKPKDEDRSPDLPKDWVQRHIDRLFEQSWYNPVELGDWQYQRSHLTGRGTYKPIDSDWRSIKVGETWGGPDTTVFLRHALTIPASHAGPDTYLDIDMDGGETQLRINGRPWQGLDHFRSLVPLGEFAVEGERLELELEAFTINYPYDERRNDKRDYHCFERANLVLRDPAIESCAYDLAFALDAYLFYWQQEDAAEVEGFILSHLEAACRLIGTTTEDREALREAATAASQHLHKHVFGSPYYRHAGTISTIAHSHLDVVYLWPIKETLRKNGRTTSNALSLLREYPEYVFSQSQPYLYDRLNEHYPELMADVRSMVAEGRWEAVGAMYIEPDANLPGAESWVRHILFGKRILRDLLGTDSRVCWLPDVFGAMYTLPQILKKAGIDYFLTAKLNIWNDTNNFPYDSFRWRGPDGSEVVAHFPPTHFAQDYTYANLKRHWGDYAEKFTAGENLFIYGWGDGGGGPTRQMLEYSRRAQQMPGLPRVQSSRADAFFDRLASRAESLPVWDDELYMEGHRGTYTSRGELKRKNRRAELLYRDIEILSSLAQPFGGPRIQERLNEGWKRLLLNQFHDTLPGTHVAEADPDIQRDYDEVFAVGESIRDELTAFFADRVAGTSDFLLFNTLGNRESLVRVELGDSSASAVSLSGGEVVPLQRDGEHGYFEARLPSVGWTSAKLSSEDAGAAQDTAEFSDNQIETRHYRIRIDDEHGSLAEIYDKQHDRQVLDAAGNAFQVFEDDPGKKFGGWDVAYHLEEYAYPVSQVTPWTLICNGPVFARFRSEWRVLNSTIRQDLVVYAKSRRIDFETQVDWQDSKKLLKVGFPLAVRSRSATYDLPFGHIERATHRNTGWEQAKFEVSGHKWADMSEGDYGVALLSDCKYGYDAHENRLRLTLVRSPVHPYRDSDIGRHDFNYSLLPHSGGWRDACVDAQAYDFNCPVLSVALKSATERAEKLPEHYSLLSLDADSAIIEVIKQAEDGDGLILRIFDSHGTHRRVRASVSPALASAAMTDLLEEELDVVPVDSDIELRFAPYEIKTLRLVLKKSA
ncbi:MAG: glycoside hydrolase family 38 C-terminal domain-containing protein [Woeseiaceae bacterium]|nr:glycoside hydrolase family 38 C-terminal domain-containing protein [Woeseiaceae bacterium]